MLQSVQIYIFPQRKLCLGNKNNILLPGDKKLYVFLHQKFGSQKVKETAQNLCVQCMRGSEKERERERESEGERERERGRERERERDR